MQHTWYCMTQGLLGAPLADTWASSVSVLPLIPQASDETFQRGVAALLSVRKLAVAYGPGQGRAGQEAVAGGAVIYRRAAH